MKNGLSLFGMIMHDDVRELEKYLHKHPKHLNNIIYLGETFLGLAAFNGDIEQMEFLIKKGINIDKFDPETGGKGPLKYAFEEHDKVKFDLLLKYGARMDLPDYTNRTLIDDLHNRGYSAIDEIPEEYWTLKIPLIELNESEDSYKKRLGKWMEENNY